MLPKVLVLDQICGSGKSKKLIEMMAVEVCPVIYITPLLSECQRVSGDPKLVHKNFQHPVAQGTCGSKMKDLERLVVAGENIVSTHALFKLLDSNLLGKIKSAGYMLICDEAINVYDQYLLNDKSDGKQTNKIMAALDENKFTTVDDDNRLVWNHARFTAVGTYFEEAARLCDMEQLFLQNNTAVFMELSVNTLWSFSKIVFATYLFEKSYLAAYLASYQFRVEVIKGDAKPSDYAHLITLVEGKINDCGKRLNALSFSSRASKEQKDALRRNLRNFFDNITDSKAGKRIWTVYNEIAESVGTNRYQRDFLAHNTKATNDYREASVVAYMVNKSSNEYLLRLIEKREEEADREVFALSEMIQFIFRSCIRDKNPITLYIPSSKMRDLFKRWLNDEFI